MVVGSLSLSPWMFRHGTKCVSATFRLLLTFSAVDVLSDSSSEELTDLKSSFSSLLVYEGFSLDDKQPQLWRKLWRRCYKHCLCS